jgi:TfoX/Sxy family transcriptional regulator of competence genes
MPSNDMAAPFSYASASGQVMVAAYYEAPGEVLDDPEGLSGWAADALRAARPVPKRKRAAS